jgi:hypothetical protein
VVAALFVTSGGIALAGQVQAGNNAAPAAVECGLVVPADPLSAAGLATPYQLQKPCHESDPGTSAFVQATIVDPATGKVSVYNPLVVDQGAKPAAAPVVPQLPTNAVVGLWFGFNGDNLTLKDKNGSLAQGSCVNGTKGSIFGQFAYCNAPQFFSTANTAIAAGKLTVPDLGTAQDGMPCLSTRDFGLVDMDQSDNVTSTYLFLPDGSTAQDTAANQASLAAKGAGIEVNGSDNLLLDSFVAPALGCTPFSAPDLADPGKMATSLALNELQAAAHQAQPVALVPTSDPMTEVNGSPNVQKTNLYRAGVNQPNVNAAVETPKAYCQNLVSIGVPRTKLDRAMTVKMKSPNAAGANSLFTFLAQRLNATFTTLTCGTLLHMGNPVTVVTDNAGVAIDATFATPPSPSPSAPRPSASASASRSPSPSASPSASASPAPTTAAPTTAAPTTAAPQPSPTTPVTSGPKKQPSSPPAVAPAPNTAPPAPASHPTTAAPPGPAPANPAAPANPPANAASTSPAAAAGPVSAPPAADNGAVIPAAAPALSVGAMPVKAAKGAPAADSGNVPMHQVAGTALLISGGLLAAGLILFKVISSRRRRYQFDDYDF